MQNLNKIRSQGCKADDDYKPMANNIPNPVIQQEKPTYKRWVWGDIDQRKSAVHRHGRARLSRFGEESLRGLTYLTHFSFFLPKFYIETVLRPQKNNRIKGGSLYLGEFLQYIVF